MWLGKRSMNSAHEHISNSTHSALKGTEEEEETRERKAEREREIIKHGNKVGLEKNNQSAVLL